MVAKDYPLEKELTDFLVNGLGLNEIETYKKSDEHFDNVVWFQFPMSLTGDVEMRFFLNKNEEIVIIESAKKKLNLQDTTADGRNKVEDFIQKLNQEILLGVFEYDTSTDELRLFSNQLVPYEIYKENCSKIFRDFVKFHSKTFLPTVTLIETIVSNNILWNKKFYFEDAKKIILGEPKIKQEIKKLIFGE